MIKNLKVVASILAFSLLIYTSCAMSSFVLTGQKLPPLSEDAHVDVIMRAIPTYKVVQIGIVKIQRGSLEQQIEKAKKVARMNGGDVLILTEVGQGVDYNKGMADTYDIRTFEVSKKVKE